MNAVANTKQKLDFKAISKEVFDLEIEQLQQVKARLGDEISEAVELIVSAKGRVVVTGIGKSGIIGKKIASSLASTGTQSFFMNAAEGLHGDLGMISRDDVVIAISNSGSSQEVIDLLPSIQRIGCRVIAMTGNPNSPLGKFADTILDIGVEREACPMNLAPTTSTTATLLMGDALVVSLIKCREFKPEKFAVYHPGGALGRRLLTRVKDLMNEEIPLVSVNANLRDIIFEISDKRLGMTLVLDNNGETVGLITDGDIRRNIKSLNNLESISAKDIMTINFKTIDKNEMANYALEVMDGNRISCLPVIENINSQKIIGVITIHDLFNFRF